MDDLRYALRKVPRIDVEMTYDEVSHDSLPPLDRPDQSYANQGRPYRS